MAVFLFLTLHPAIAATAGCDPGFDINRFVDGITAAEDAIAAANVPTAQVVLGALYRDVPCLADRVHPRHLVRYGRAAALTAFADHDEAETSYWGQMALIDPSVRWPGTIDPAHPGRETLNVQTLRPPLTLETRGLAVPKGGAILVDGQLVRIPEASPEAPHLIQRLDSNGDVVESLWLDGVIWPERLLTADPTPAGLPRWSSAPEADLDPYRVVHIDPSAQAYRAEARADAASARRRVETQLAAALERERIRAARRQARAARRGEIPSTAATPRATAGDLDEAVAWVDVFIEPAPLDLDDLDVVGGTKACEDLVRLEPRSLLGRLTDTQITCLQHHLVTAERQTTKGHVSRLLMADAWAKGDHHRWEAAVRRHLEQIDRSDPDLCYIFARWLAIRGQDAIPEALRWSRTALENAHYWVGDAYVHRVDGLHRLNAVASQSLWLQAEEEAVHSRRPEHRERATFWRNQTKTSSREWLLFATAAELDTHPAFELCISAAGTVEYCDVR